MHINKKSVLCFWGTVIKENIKAAKQKILWSVSSEFVSFDYCKAFLLRTRNKKKKFHEKTMKIKWLTTEQKKVNKFKQLITRISSNKTINITF